MQESSPIAPPVLGLTAWSRRNLLVAVAAAAVLVVGAYLVFHASGTPPGKKHLPHVTHPRIAIAVCPGHARGNHATCSANRPVHHQPSRARRRIPVAAPHRSLLNRYAVALLPVLDRTRRLMDQANRAISTSPSLDVLGSDCNYYGPYIQLKTEQVDGVPHAGPWYTSVGSLHHQTLDIYHRARGAMLLCVTAAGNGDGGASATAVADIGHATIDLRAMDDYVRWLTKHAK